MYIILWTIAERFGLELDLRYDDIAQQWNISLYYPEYRLRQEFYIYDETKVYGFDERAYAAHHVITCKFADICRRAAEKIRKEGID